MSHHQVLCHYMHNRIEEFWMAGDESLPLHIGYLPSLHDRIPSFFDHPAGFIHCVEINATSCRRYRVLRRLCRCASSSGFVTFSSPVFYCIKMELRSLISYFVCLLGLVCAQSNSSGTYTNPILDAVGADPWVIRHDGYYYMTYTTATNITILRSKILTDWNNADAKLAFQPPEGKNYSTDLYIPKQSACVRG